MAVFGSVTADLVLTPGPTDSITTLRWSSVANHLATSSWDSTLRIYDVNNTGTRPSGRGVLAQAFSAPILSCDWSKDGTLIVTGTADKKAFILDLNAPSSAPTQVAAHEAPIKSVRFVTVPGANGPILATGSWDSTIKFWDLRQAQPLTSLTCDGKVYSMDTAGMLLCAATSACSIHIIDLNHPTTFKMTKQSLLKKQIRSIACFPDGNGYVAGAVEGRCAFTYLDPDKASNDYSFKCHRFDAPSTTDQKPIYSSTHRSIAKAVDVYAINDVSAHPKYAVFSSAGADGGFSFWDRDARARLKTFAHAPAKQNATNVASSGILGEGSSGMIGGKAQPTKASELRKAGEAAITATGFNHDGSLFAYAVGYDWSKGHTGSKADREDRIMVHVVGDEAKPKNALSGGK